MVSSKKMVRGVALMGAAVLAVAGFSSSAQASLIFLSAPSYTLAQLAPVGGNMPAFVVNDPAVTDSALVFYNFQVLANTGDAPSPSDVIVTPETLVIGGQTTIGFNLSGGFLDLPTSFNASDFSLHYNVASLSGNPTITDAHILGDPAVFGSGSASVTETWTPDVTTQYNRIYDIEPGQNTLLADTVIFNQQYASLMVQKDILLQVPNAPATGNVATISSIDQTYSVSPNGGGGQTTTPEPATVGLLGLGAVGMIARRRRSA